MIFFGFMVTRLKANRGARVLILTVFVLIFLIVAWLGWGPVLDRFGEIKDVRGAVTDVRTIMWKDGFNIARDFPLTGTGAGSFASIYPKYRTLMEAGSVEHAHNDYLEMFAEGGIIAFLLASCYGFSLLYKSYKSFIMRKETYSTYLYIGSLTGIIAILVHSLVDFNLHIGSNGLYFFFIAGLAVAAANTRLRKDHSYLKLLKPSRCRVALVLTSFLLVAVLSFNVGLILGRMQFSLIDNFRPGRDIDKKDIMAVRDDIRMASLFDPLESWYPFIGAKFDTLLSNKESARHQFLNALKLEPANGEYLQRVGLLFDDMHNADTAEKFLKAGIAFDRSNPERYQAYASWLFEKGKRQDALAVIKKVVFLYPDLAGEYIDFMSHNGIEDGEMRSELPERMASYLALGDYMDSKGREDDAENAYQCALSFARNADIRDKSYFLRVANYYEKRGLLEKALYVMRLARAYLPKDAGIHLASGELYERLRMNNMAAEEYRSASILDPVNPDARNKLAGLRGGN
jgi:tetratricopeptide (TPR) repeat protein